MTEFTPKKIVVVGTGYVGLPAALMLAKAGHQVVGIDINENIVRAINEGVMLIDEAELKHLMDDPTVRANLTAQTTPIPGDVFIIAVPTPLDPRRKIADLSMVRDATASLVPHLRPGNLVILESTVPPLTCREVMTPILEQSGLQIGVNLFLAHCPERILPGDIFYEIVHNDRIIGAADETARRLAIEVYASFVKGHLYETDDVTAEFVKLTENTFRDVNIALANELNAVADTLGIDGVKAIELANKHPRVNILRPGIGVGGHCIPIDPWFIHEVDPANARLIYTARNLNDAMPAQIAARIRRAVRKVNNPRLVLIGAAYKPNVEDMRESPALEIVHHLRDDGYDLVHHDPLVKGLGWTGTLAEVCAGADLLAVIVPHTVVLQEIEATRTNIEAAMRTPNIVIYGA